MNDISQTDWERVSKLSDDDIDFSDVPETTEEFWKDAEWFLPSKRDSLINVLKHYKLKSDDIKMLVMLVERLAH